MPKTTSRRRITAETFRPERVDAEGRPEMVTGDAPVTAAPGDPPPPPPSGGSSGPRMLPVMAVDHEAPAPAPAAPHPAPAPAAAASAPPAATPGPGGVTTAEILAALGVERSAVRVTREPSPYAEGAGISEKRGFFADLYAARSRGDGEAAQRVAKFQAQLTDYIAAANSIADSGQIIPPAWGGQWFVDEIAKQRPCVGAFSSGSISNPSPFPVPRFKDTTPSALVADHVEGTPDTAGTVNFDQVMVTPKAKSGRAEVSRELIDSAPQLADRVISGALRESYAQITESTMAGVLVAGATPGPAGGATAASTEGAIRAALGNLPGTRFAPARVILPSAHIWGALVAADAPDGRPLIPYMGYGPTNAAGTAQTAYARGGIAGVDTVPAWALPAGDTIIGAGPNDAMSFESSVLEFRFAEKSGPELIEFNVWGYFAAVVLQPKGVILVTSTALGTQSAEGNGGDDEPEGEHEGRTTTSGRGTGRNGGK